MIAIDEMGNSWNEMIKAKLEMVSWDVTWRNTGNE
jgi:hypothetical protein